MPVMVPWIARLALASVPSPAKPDPAMVTRAAPRATRPSVRTPTGLECISRLIPTRPPRGPRRPGARRCRGPTSSLEDRATVRRPAGAALLPPDAARPIPRRRQAVPPRPTARQDDRPRDRMEAGARGRVMRPSGTRTGSKDAAASSRGFARTVKVAYGCGGEDPVHPPSSAMTDERSIKTRAFTRSQRSGINNRASPSMPRRDTRADLRAARWPGNPRITATSISAASSRNAACAPASAARPWPRLWACPCPSSANTSRAPTA